MNVRSPNIRQRKKILIIIPARNEGQTVARVIKDTQAIASCDIVVVDDASTDNTIEEARKSGAEVLPLSLQLGAWGATQTGLRFALQNQYETVVTLDADGQHDPLSISELLTPLLQGKADVVIGSFPRRGSWQRQAAWHFFKWVTDLNLDDLTSGYRAYNQKAIEILSSRDATLLDYQDVGVLLLLQKNGMHITEVETVMKQRTTGHSRIFSTWGAVFTYMLHSIILSFCRRNKTFSAKPLLIILNTFGRRLIL